MKFAVAFLLTITSCYPAFAQLTDGIPTSGGVYLGADVAARGVRGLICPSINDIYSYASKNVITINDGFTFPEVLAEENSRRAIPGAIATKRCQYSQGAEFALLLTLLPGEQEYVQVHEIFKIADQSQTDVPETADFCERFYAKAHAEHHGEMRILSCTRAAIGDGYITSDSPAN